MCQHVRTWGEETAAHWKFKNPKCFNTFKQLPVCYQLNNKLIQNHSTLEVRAKGKRKKDSTSNRELLSYIYIEKLNIGLFPGCRHHIIHTASTQKHKALKIITEINYSSNNQILGIKKEITNKHSEFWMLHVSLLEHGEVWQLSKFISVSDMLA